MTIFWVGKSDDNAEDGNMLFFVKCNGHIFNNQCIDESLWPGYLTFVQGSLKIYSKHQQLQQQSNNNQPFFICDKVISEVDEASTDRAKGSLKNVDFCMKYWCISIK